MHKILLNFFKKVDIAILNQYSLTEYNFGITISSLKGTVPIREEQLSYGRTEVFALILPQQ